MPHVQAFPKKYSILVVPFPPLIVLVVVVVVIVGDGVCAHICAFTHLPITEPSPQPM